jgi:ectoine hydroxylase-related dioxygenase (phytanoyl-CoA dioxygenase family)
MSILLTEQEREAGVLSPESLADAIGTFRDTGLVVIENVYDMDFIAEVRAAYDRELERFLAGKGGLDALDGKTFGKNHIGFFPALYPPLSDPRIAAPPVAVQLLTELLGADFTSCFYNTNTACPGSGTQPVHRDSSHLFGAELGVPHPPAQIVLNIPLVDFTEENGSTEYWPGSHLIVDRTPEDGKRTEERAAGYPSIRLNLPVGSFALRDLRAWHRGKPNHADYPRTMFAIVYVRSWLAATPMKIPRSTWEAWPERVQHIYRKNTVMEDAEYRPMLWEELH